MRAILSVLLVGLITSDHGASAQVAFRPMGKVGLPFGVETTSRIAHGDFDGDGDLDLAMGREHGVDLLRNDGLGRFSPWTPSSIPSLSAPISALALGDLDGDGDADLLVAEGDWYAPSASWYRNQGGGSFVRVPGSLPSLGRPSFVFGFALGDIDGDRDLDVAAVWTGDDMLFIPSTVQFWINDGAGSFAAQYAPTMATSVSQAVFADVDGDGDLDVAGGGYPFWTKIQTFPGQTWLLRNDGNLRFTDRTGQAMPVDSRTVGGFALRDIDGDADPDVVLGELGGNRAVYLNDGHGIFSIPPTLRLPVGPDGSHQLVAADFDGDGDVDVITAHARWSSYRYEGARLRFLENGGNGFFLDLSFSAFPAITAAAFALDAADVDGDGDVDLVSGNWREPALLWMNRGDAHFSAVCDAGLPIASLSFTDVAAGDVNGDGEADLVLSGFNAGETRLHRGNGRGGFVDETAARFGSLVPNGAHAVALADLNGDGSLDLLLLTQNALEMRLNDRQGRFRTATQTLAAPAGKALDVGDIDGDGDLDVAVGGGSVTFPHSTRIFRYEDRGRLVERRELLPELPIACYDLRFADADGDGDLDLIAANEYGTNLLFSNDGHGTFSVSDVLPLPRIPAMALGVGDVDGDGDLDLLFAAPGTAPNRLLLRRPDGSYDDVTATQLPAVGAHCVHVELADLDADGDLDAVLACGGPPDPPYPGDSAAFELLWNDGRGFFQAQAPAFPPILWSSAVAIADLDGDGDRDLALANYDQQSIVLLSTLRQIAAPHACVSARPWTLELYGRALTPQHPSALALWMIGSAFLDPPATIGAFGTLRVDPARLFVASCSYLPAFGAPLELRFVVPHDPWVVGADFGAQFLLFYDAAFAEARFSNAISERILPP